jgi:hypothetical protein
LAQLLDRGRDTVFVLHDSSVGPQLRDDVLVRHHVTGTLQQYEQDLKGLLLETNPAAVFAQLSSRNVQVKDPKTNSAWRMSGFFHEDHVARNIVRLSATKQQIR